MSFLGNWKASSKITFFVCITIILVASMAYGYLPEIIQFARDLIGGIYGIFGGVKA